MENIKNDRMERYIYQATKMLPKKNRGDIEQELRTLINDMLEERCGDREPTQKDIDVVLIELGDPSDLAAKYTDQNRYLIGPPIFPKYWMVLKIVLLCVAGGITIAMVIGALADPAPRWEMITDWIATLASALFGAFTWVTIAFAIVENKDWLKERNIIGDGITEIEQEIAKDKTSGSFLDSLPEVPKRNAVIKRSDPIFGIVFSVIWLIVLTTAPQIIGIYWKVGNDTVRIATIFDLDVLRSVTVLLIIATMLGIFRDMFKLMEGRYTKRLAIAAVAFDVPALLISIYVFTRENLFNPNLLRDLTIADADMGRDLAEIWGFFDKVWIILLAMIVLGFIIEMATTVYKGIKYD